MQVSFLSISLGGRHGIVIFIFLFIKRSKKIKNYKKKSFNLFWEAFLLQNSMLSVQLSLSLIPCNWLLHHFVFQERYSLKL